jgi:hypothetical protein
MQGIRSFDTYDLEDVGLEDFGDLIQYYSQDYDHFDDATLEIRSDLH